MNYDEMPAGPELDRLVAELMGWSIGPAIRYDMVGNEIRYKAWVWPGYNDDNDFAWGVEEWRPSTNIAHAWEVVETIKAKVLLVRGDTWVCEIHMGALATADTAPLAICRAALKAMAAK